MPKAEIELKKQMEIVDTDKEIKPEPGEFRAILELVVKDANGKVTERRVQKSESFVRQFLELLMVQAAQISVHMALPVTDVAGNSAFIYAGGHTFNTNAAANDDSFGVQVGTGATPPTINDHRLESKISHGVGVGQLQHGGVTYGLPASDPTTSHFTITRDFSNASGSAVTVNEIGIVVKALDFSTDYSPVDRYILTIRDVVAGGISVPNGETLTVNYRLQASI